MSYEATVIISVYDNVEFLKVVLDSLKIQTCRNFEIIISEDACHKHVSDFIDSYPFENDFQHITQPDEGWQKNRALNRAIQAARSDWFIFIDGDCILHPRFIEMHLHFASPNRILAGKRVKLDEDISKKVLSGMISVYQLQSVLVKKLFTGRGKIQFLEEGIFISPHSPLGFIPELRKISYLKGCNMSFSRKAIESINGFDEDYIRPAIGEDIDLSWRFNAIGYTHFSLRNRAVTYHIHHKQGWLNQEENKTMMTEKQGRNQFFCKNGINKS